MQTAWRFRIDVGRTLCILDCHVQGAYDRSKSVRKSGVRVGEGIGEGVGKILAYLRIRPEATIAELADKAGVSTRSVERNPRSLILSGCLKRVGPDRGGRWDVVK